MEKPIWLKIMIERQVEFGYTNKFIAEKVEHSEKTISRFFSGETKEPDIVLFSEIAVVLDLSIDALLAGYKAPMGYNIIKALQEDVERLTEDGERLTTELALANAEITVLKDKVTTATAESDFLRLKLEHKEEIIENQKRIIAVHDYYMNRKTNE